MKNKTLLQVLLTVALIVSIFIIYGCGSATTSGGSSSSSTPKLYISDSVNNRILVINPSSLESPISSIEVTGAITIQWMAIHPNGSKLYVADEGSNRVYIVDTSSDTVTGLVTVCSTPRGMDFNSNGSKLFVACGGGSAIAIVDTSTDTFNNNPSTDTIYGMGSVLYGLAYSADTNKLYICNYGANSVDMVTAEANSLPVVTSLSIPGVYDIAVTPDGKKVYATAGFNLTGTGYFLTSIEANNLTKVATWAATSAYGSFRNIAATPNGKYILAANHDEAYIDCLYIETGTKEAIDFSDSSSEMRPGQIAVSPDSSKAFIVSSYNTTEVVAINMTTKQKIGALVLPSSGSYFGIVYKP